MKNRMKQNPTELLSMILGITPVSEMLSTIIPFLHSDDIESGRWDALRENVKHLVLAYVKDMKLRSPDNRQMIAAIASRIELSEINKVLIHSVDSMENIMINVLSMLKSEINTMSDPNNILAHARDYNVQQQTQFVHEVSMLIHSIQVVLDYSTVCEIPQELKHLTMLQLMIMTNQMIETIPTLKMTYSITKDFQISPEDINIDPALMIQFAFEVVEVCNRYYESTQNKFNTNQFQQSGFGQFGV